MYFVCLIFSGFDREQPIAIQLLVKSADILPQTSVLYHEVTGNKYCNTVLDKMLVLFES